ncbi:MAG TPA: TIM-barrel domain-containing protein [Polyangia bacterium]|jgi:alpha-glucosidase|nr:TIM-barrel domain-containing protein [Polyangia bacterium]
MTKAQSLALLSLSSVLACAQTQAPPAPPAVTAAVATGAPEVKSFEAGPHGVTLRTTAGVLAITAVNDHVVRVRAAREPDGRDLLNDFSWAIVPGANTPQAAMKVTDEGGSILAATPAVRVRIQKHPLRLAFLDAAGHVVSQDAGPMAIGANGFRVTHAMPDDEHYFGLGDKAGPLDRRDMAFTNWNTDAYAWQESTDPLYKTIPFFLALRGGRAHGFFVDNTWRSWFDFGKTARDAYGFGADGGALDYYFIDGPDPKAVVARYADLTGKAPLPPLWTLGFQQCRYSYYPEARVREVARTFRDKKIPADVIYLDIDYQKDNRPFTIDTERFPHFDQMISDLGREGFKVIAITDLHLAKAPGYAPYDQGLAGNDFVHAADGSVYVGKVWPGDSVFPDFTWAPARAWWGTLYEDFVRRGIAGFWNDMNEPSVFWSQKTMPLDAVHRTDAGGTTTHREAHNVFGMENSRATYEGLLKLQGNRRPVVLTRATYAGGQRYAASWTGDNSSTWNHYRISIPMLLNLGLSGFSFVGDDIGGFRGSPQPELLTRWIGLGAFNPIFRDHSEKGTLDQEPWVHGAEHEAMRRKFIEARYRLLPYVYTIAEEASRTGIPMMRPFWLEHPEADAFTTNGNVFLFGPDLLIEPKIDETMDPVETVVPPGVWYDYWTGERLTKAPAKKLPSPAELTVLVRGGAIVPHQPLVQSTSETPKGPLELRVYPGPDCKGALYADDGQTFDYRAGAFVRVPLACTEAADGVTVEMGAAEGAFTPWFSSVAFAIHGAKSKPKQVTVAGKPVRDFSYDAGKRVVVVPAPYVKSGQKVTVTYERP